ncbi:hypothetical protein [Pseudoduganella sp. R-34]|uniref:hypothetical protein n=1 Tax=unclassified Pseudoduganella TaxID=2637179 RepID=UPI003CF40B9A
MKRYLQWVAEGRLSLSWRQLSLAGLVTAYMTGPISTAMRQPTFATLERCGQRLLQRFSRRLVSSG